MSASGPLVTIRGLIVQSIVSVQCNEVLVHVACGQHTGLDKQKFSA